MEKYRMIFYDECVAMDQNKFDREDAFGYIKHQRYSTRFSNVKLYEGKDFDKYILFGKDSVIEIVFPIQCFHANKKYINILNSWREIDRKRSLIAGACALAVIATIGAGCALSTEKGKEKLNDAKFYLENIKELNAINHLEYEILAHAGHGEVEGHKQSIKNHENSFCYLGNDVNLSVVDEAIKKYCEKNGLGEDVAYSAIEKYDYLLQDDIQNAYKIELASEYKESMQKTLK